MPIVILILCVVLLICFAPAVLWGVVAVALVLAIAAGAIFAFALVAAIQMFSTAECWKWKRWPAVALALFWIGLDVAGGIHYWPMLPDWIRK